MFFKKQPKESPDELANRLQREGRTSDLENELQQYTLQKLSDKDKESYYHLWGISAFLRGDRKEAFHRFKIGLDTFPQSQNLLFSLGQEHEHRREIDQMFQCFDRCSYPQIPSPTLLAIARYAYLWNRSDKGIAYLKSITEAYFQLGIVDDHFLYMRGLPFFGQTWSYIMAFSCLLCDFTLADEFFSNASGKLQDYDFESACRFYECVKSNDYTLVIKHLENGLKERNPQFPQGYPAVQLASFKIRSLDEQEALSILDAIKLLPNDFPWLSDVITIEKASIYNRSGNRDAEKMEVDRFLQKQKMLFEPDHAISFGFLSYQETLKPRYQNQDK